MGDFTRSSEDPTLKDLLSANLYRTDVLLLRKLSQQDEIFKWALGIDVKGKKKDGWSVGLLSSLTCEVLVATRAALLQS